MVKKRELMLGSWGESGSPSCIRERHIWGRLYTALYLVMIFAALLVVSTPSVSYAEQSDAAKESEPEGESARAAKRSTKDAESEEEGVSAPAAPFHAEAAPPLPTLSGEKVLVVPLHGTIDRGLPAFLRRSIREHGDAALLVLDVNTFGGRVDAAVEIRDLLLRLEMPVVAFINKRAISAGALISFAADYIVFSEGSTMGAATPIQLQQGQAKAVGEKTVSYFRSEMRTTAESNGWSGRLAEAMVDAEIEIPEVSPKGKLLTVTTKQALEWGLCNQKIDRRSELLKALGLGTAKVIEMKEDWGEQLARFLTDPTVSGMLMSIGTMGIIVELYKPGVGLPGAVGVIALTLFFAGHMAAELADWGEVMLFLLGILLLLVEIMILPGFGVAGIAGLFFMGLGLVLAMGESGDGGWSWEVFGEPLNLFTYSMAGAIAGISLLFYYLPHTPLGSWLVLKDKLSADNERRDTTSAVTEETGLSRPSYGSLIGVRGVAVSTLRLSGKAEIQGEVYDVMSRDHFMDPGDALEVVAVEGGRLIVTSPRESERVEAPTEPTPTDE